MSYFAPALEGTKPDQYAQLNQQLALLIGDERDFVANMANMAALLFHQLPDLNWAGFYLMKEGELVLGPFQGKPACIRIPLGRGVCGTAAATRETQVVPDVHAFPGHIACDADSRSEIVVPLIKDGVVVGVLDLDSPRPGRFDEDDRAGLEAAAGCILGASLMV
ncbi:GAF domain-containing protein [Sandarakinorhabdus oryzae]|uniref:GAF domain-containing protein n=1 Tax=Sandarakinorhabdus oryzae TaxID=2675220 RepID=UPI0012E2F6C5|nr:GAF domain-containing protein [Sandarakinorhabdus oryzae]